MVINKSRLSLNVKKEQNDDFCMEIREPNSFSFHEIGFSCFCL